MRRVVLSSISIHSLRMEGDAELVCKLSKNSLFQSTPSAWRETYLGRGEKAVDQHFNPLPPHGGRLVDNCTYCPWRAFQSTPSAWRETRQKGQARWKRRFQSTPSAWRETGVISRTKDSGKYFNPLPPHGGRPVPVSSQQVPCTISIHSLRMEGDFYRCFRCTHQPISIHSLRMEGDVLASLALVAVAHFNPLPPHGGRRS